MQNMICTFRRLIFLACMTATLSSCSSTEQAKQQAAGAAAFPPVPVSIAQAVEEKVPIEVRAFGTVEPFASVDVKSQVAGPLVRVLFTEGTDVQKGDLLFEIDP